jgi:hypothetical protein
MDNFVDDPPTRKWIGKVKDVSASTPPQRRPVELRTRTMP